MQNLFSFILGIPTVFAQSVTAKDASASPANTFQFIIEHLPLWITAIFVILVFILIAIITKKSVENRLANQITEEHEEVFIIVGRVVFVTVVTIGILIAMSIAGINLTTLLAAIGFGISFGLQDTIANFVAGIALLASRPFQIGDWIKVNGKTGKVVEIRTRATYLKTYDGLRLIVPNSQLYKSQVLSYTSNSMRRLKVPAYARYGVDIKKVKEICLNEVKKNPRIFLEPKANVIVKELADSYISLQVRFWVDPKGPWRKVQSAVFINIQKALEEAGMDAPYAVTSLSLEPEIESYFVRTKEMDSNELTNLMNERMKEEEKFSKNRAQVPAIKAVPAVTHQSTDESGASFLHGDTTAKVETPVIAAQPTIDVQTQPQMQTPTQTSQNPI